MRTQYTDVCTEKNAEWMSVVVVGVTFGYAIDPITDLCNIGDVMWLL